MFSLSPRNGVPDLLEAAWVLGGVSFPICVGVFVGGVLASLAATGLYFEPTWVLPRASRVDVAAALRRWWSTAQLKEWGKALGVGVLLVCAAAGSLNLEGGDLGRLVLQEGFPAFLAGQAEVGRVLGRMLFVLTGLGLLAALWARYRHSRRLRMSRSEVRRDLREEEGDPALKGRRRALHRQLALGGPARGIAAATTLVVNPTHLAVALRYEPRETDAPYVVAKGREVLASRLREEAQSLSVPIVKDVPLARSLIGLSLGEQIPEELYVAAAAAIQVARETRQGEG
jgi:type III secretion protein U